MVYVTLSPAVTRSGTYTSSLWRPAAFTAAAALAGASTGAALGKLGGQFSNQQRAAFTTAICAGALVLAALDLLGRPVRVPGRSRETPRGWMQLNPITAAVLNGTTLGTGWSTRIGFWLWFAVPLGSLLSGSVIGGIVVYGAYGLTRGLGPWLLLLLARSRSHGQGKAANVRGLGESVIARSATMRVAATFDLCGLGLVYLVGSAL